MEHPNSIISAICSRAGIQLLKGEAASIHEKVPDLDKDRILSIARGSHKMNSRKKAKQRRKASVSVNLPKRVGIALEKVIPAFLSDHPDLSPDRGEILNLATTRILEHLRKVGDETGESLDADILLASLAAPVERLRERAAMLAWIAARKAAPMILRACLTPEIWRAHAGWDAELETVLLRETEMELQRIGAEVFPDPSQIMVVLETPIPVEGGDPVAEGRARWDKLWTLILPERERACGRNDPNRRGSRKRRLLLLDRMFPGDTEEKRVDARVAAIDALIKAREEDAEARRKRAADLLRERRAYEARLVRRDELETLLPATKTETLRWIGDGRISVAMRREFQKWGKSLQVTMHDPDLIPGWRALIEDWRAADQGVKERARGDSRARQALITRVTKLVAAAMPDSAHFVEASAAGGKTILFDLHFFATIDVPLERDVGPPGLPVPIRIRLDRSHWDAVADKPVTGPARKAAIEKLRTEVVDLVDAYRRTAATLMVPILAEIDAGTRELPDDMMATFRRSLGESLRLPSSKGQTPQGLAKLIGTQATQVMRRIEDLHRDRVLGRASGLEDYPALFREARMIRRELHLHLGPTNSGKTHAAIARLRAAESGLYAAPLRLMAMEWAERLNAEGVPTDLVTGEEIIRVAEARHESVTIEMCSMKSKVDVAVIDEAQMIADPERGWAWTQAILGLPAREIHLTGSPDAEPWVTLLAEMTQDRVFVHRYERLVPLKTTDGPVSIDDVGEGDAIIAFSRTGVLRLKSDMQSAGLSVATIYGALSPEVRREEARRFRSGEAEVLVSTDAIGMGLNLPIRRVLFSEGDKFDGVSRRPLLDAEVRQIAGRAGRFGLSEVEAGLCGVYLKDETLPSDAESRLQLRIGKAISGKSDIPQDVRPWVKPGREVVGRLGELMGTNKVAAILNKVDRDIIGRSEIFLSGITRDMIMVGAMMDRTPLSLDDRYTYACAPVDTRDEFSSGSLVAWVGRHAKGKSIVYDIQIPKRLKRITRQDDLSHAESLVKATGLYLWCAFRWPDVYVGAEEALASRQGLNAAISEALKKEGLARSCRECGRSLHRDHAHAICDPCHREMRSFRSWG